MRLNKCVKELFIINECQRCIFYSLSQGSKNFVSTKKVVPPPIFVSKLQISSSTPHLSLPLLFTTV